MAASELPLNERKRVFGVAYLRAVAAVAGYSVSVPESDFDSIDATLRSRQGKRWGLDVQVKCSARDDLKGSHFPFVLSKKNFDDLRTEVLFPRLLLVVLVPADIEYWLLQSERLMLFRRCGYWASLYNLAERPGRDDVTISIPRNQILTPTSLRQLMMREIGT